MCTVLATRMDGRMDYPFINQEYSTVITWIASPHAQTQ